MKKGIEKVPILLPSFEIKQYFLRRIWLITLFFQTILCFRAIAETEILGGDISGISFDAKYNPYIIQSNIEIPSAKHVIIPAGCIFLFKQYVGLNVNGSLIIHGTSLNPVIFTSYYDSVYNSNIDSFPSTFDWNGIEIENSDSNTSISNLNLKYSVYGIKSIKGNITLDSCIFSNNVQYNLTVKGNLMNVPDLIPFSYNVIPLPKEVTVEKTINKESVAVYDVYINSSPSGALIFKDCHRNRFKYKVPTSPFILSDQSADSTKFLLFKEGFNDTLITIYRPCSSIVKINPKFNVANSEYISMQNKFLRQRRQSYTARFVWIGSALFAVGSGVSFYLAQNDYKDAEHTKSLLESSIVRDGSTYHSLLNENSEKSNNGDLKTMAGIGCMCLAAVLGTTGFILYF